MFCAGAALLFGFMHLLFGLLAATPDLFHFDAQLPAAPEYVRAAVIAGMGVILTIGGAVAIFSRRHVRAALLSIAFVMALDAAKLILVQASRHRLGQADREHLLMMGVPTALAALCPLVAWRVRRHPGPVHAARTPPLAEMNSMPPSSNAPWMALTLLIISSEITSSSIAFGRAELIFVRRVLDGVLVQGHSESNCL